MNTTESEKNQEKNEQFNILFKSVLKGFKSDFQSYPISDIPHKLPIAYQSYQNGFQNIYLEPVISNPENSKEELHWLILDIESKEDHHNVKENINLTKDICTMLDEKGLLTDCYLALTGYGFRLIYPCYIPTEYSKAFIEFVTDFAPRGIDAGLNKDRKFVRIAGYRNHEFQCGKKSNPIDRHIHYLDDPYDIFFMTESEYIDLCTGKPDHESDKAIIPQLLPTRPIPNEWIEFLKEYEKKALLSDCIWRGYPIARKGKLTKEQLETVLGDNVLKTDEHEIFGVYVNLKKCPRCNLDGSYVTEYGRLKCYHTSCQERDEKGKPVGLPASEWNSDLADMVSGIEDDTEVSEPENIIVLKSISDVRIGISTAYAINARVDYLITAMPGVGKTTTTLKAIAPKCNDETFLYLTISHKLCNEIADKAKDFGIENIQVLTGRNEKNCINHSNAKKTAEQGYSIKFTMCFKCPKYREKEEIDPVTGEVIVTEKCDYMKQFDLLKKPGLVIAPYQSANFKKVLDSFSFLDGLQKMTVIIDENPINAFTAPILTDSDAIRFFRVGSNELVHSFYDKLQKVIDDTFEKLLENKGRYDTHARLYTGQAPKGSQWENLPNLFELAGITQDEIDAMDRHLDNHREQISEKTGKLETEREWQQRLYKNNINFNAFKWLDNAINHGTAYIKIDSRRVNEKIRYVTFKKNLPDFTGCRLINLDATGNKSELDSLFGRDFQVIDGNVEMPGLKKTWIKQNTGKTQIIRLDDKKIADRLKKAIPYLRDTDKKILILTFQKVKDRVLESAKKLLPDKTLDVIYFGAGRGLNQWQDFDAVICLGWLNINKKDSLDLAQLLYDNDQDRADFVFRTGKNEVLQGVHRIRPVFGNKNIIIIARNWLSELGSPDEIVSSQNRPELFEDAVHRCDGWIKRFGCIDKQAFYALGICSKDDYEKADYAYQIFKQIRIDKDLGMFRDESLLKFGKDNTVYSKLIETLAKNHDLPLCEIKVGYNWIKALGNIEDFQKYYEFFGEDFDVNSYRPAKETMKKPEKAPKSATRDATPSKFKHKGLICKGCRHYGTFNCLRLWQENKELLPLIYKDDQDCEHFKPKKESKIYA